METSFGKMASRFLDSESGDSAIEYGFLMALLSLALIVSLQAAGASLSNLFNFVSVSFNGAIPAAPTPATPPHSG